jgi:RNA recognition motif-containing protein
MSEPRSEEVEAAPGSDRQTDRIVWPGQHTVLIWQGGDIANTKSLIMNDGRALPASTLLDDPDEWAGKKRRQSSEVEREADPISPIIAPDAKQPSVSKIVAKGKEKRKSSSDSSESEWEVTKSRQRNGGGKYTVPKANDTKIFVKNLPWKTTLEDLSTNFSPAGVIRKVEVLKDNRDRSLGLGVVEYSSSEEAEAAINSLNGSLILGRKIMLEKYKNKGSPGDVSSEERRPPRAPEVPGGSNKIFVKNIKWSTDESGLREALVDSGGLRNV